MTDMANAPLRLTGDPEADQLLTDDDNALLIGMVSTSGCVNDEVSLLGL